MTVALYRLRDKEARLLYVGISTSLMARLQQHAAGKRWWPAVSTIDVEHFPNRQAAAAAEAAAIASESPVHNVVMAIPTMGGWQELRRARRNRGHTLTSLAKAAGMSLGYLSDLENGRRRPNATVTKKLAVALNVPASVLEKPLPAEELAS